MIVDLLRSAALTFLLVQPFILFGQFDEVGSGRAIQFDGVDDLINYGDTYADLEMPFTVSAWVYLDPTNPQIAPIFSNRNCHPIYTGFRLMVNANLLSLEYGDGRGGNSPAFRNGIQANVDLLKGTWNHITAVVSTPNDMRLYLNGINVGGTRTGSSVLTMDSSKPGFGSTAYFISNAVVYRFKGMIDEIRLWNRSLSEVEIRNTMCIRLTGNEPGLIGYWNFDETTGATVYDKSTRKSDGFFQGNPARVYSGAPIGNTSSHLYTSDFVNKTITHQNADKKIIVSNISDNTPAGVHLYYVDHLPSRTLGLEQLKISNSYFGVFLARPVSVATFDVQLSTSEKNCEIAQRIDNSDIPWTDSPGSSIHQRVEVIGNRGMQFSLGSDRVACAGETYKLSTELDAQAYSFLWNTGETTSSIMVSEPGDYVVQVTGGCGALKDSVAVVFKQPPTPFSLGENQVSCELPSVILQTPHAAGSISYEWQDGSKSDKFKVVDFGSYSVTVKNDCGEESSSITFSKPDSERYFVPNIITPNNDGKNDYFELTEPVREHVTLSVFNRWGQLVYNESNYNNGWDASLVPSGVYFISIKSSCYEEVKSTLHIQH